MAKNKRIFLGGTIDSKWREHLIPFLDDKIYNPVVKDWTPEKEKEIRRVKFEDCDFHLYVFTPKMKGFIAVAEFVESAHMMPDKTAFLFCSADDGIHASEHLLRNFDVLGEIAGNRLGAEGFLDSFSMLIEHLNGRKMTRAEHIRYNMSPLLYTYSKD